MQDTTSFNSNMDTLFSDLQDFVKTGSVLGSPLKVEDKTIVPLMSVTLGYGSTGMGAKSSMGGGTNTSSGGVGLGARVSTSGVIVVDKNSVQVIPANSANNMSQLMEKIPEAISNMGQSMMGQSAGGQGQQQQGQQQGQNQQQNQPQNQQNASQDNKKSQQ
jgi:uncharacterized spore protein YtfJ